MCVATFLPQNMTVQFIIIITGSKKASSIFPTEKYNSYLSYTNVSTSVTIWIDFSISPIILSISFPIFDRYKDCTLFSPLFRLKEKNLVCMYVVCMYLCTTIYSIFVANKNHEILTTLHYKTTLQYKLQ